MRLEAWVEGSAIVFVNNETNVLLDCVAVAIFVSAKVWSCCILVNNDALDFADCTFASYPLVFEVLGDLRVSLMLFQS